MPETTGGGNQFDLVGELGAALSMGEQDRLFRPALRGLDAVLVSARLGVVAFRAVGGSLATLGDAPTALSSTVDDLRVRLRGGAELPVAGFAVLLDEPRPVLGSGRTPFRRVISIIEARSGAWAAALPAVDLPPEVVATTVVNLEPAAAVRRTIDRSDPGRAGRDARRLILDQAQLGYATVPPGGVLEITGCAGSGKSLVLAARARWLAHLEPGRRIVVLAFTNALAENLKGLLNDVAGVEVSTVVRWMDRVGFPRGAGTLEANGHLRDRFNARNVEPFDALLVDEAQDLATATLQMLIEAASRAEYGITLAYDPGQSLYHDGAVRPMPCGATQPAVPGLTTTSWRSVYLTRPYRSTQEVLRVAALMGTSSNSSITETELAPTGRPVRVVYAGSWDGQAQFVAHEVERLAAGGAAWQEIGIVCTQRAATLRRLTAALAARGIPHREGADGVRAGDAVHLLTVHAAKGLEFRHVFLFGLEAVSTRKSEAPDTGLRRLRVGFVGATRPTDTLTITWTRPGPLLDLIRRSPDVDMKTWPDDFEDD